MSNLWMDPCWPANFLCCFHSYTCGWAQFWPLESDTSPSNVQVVSRALSKRRVSVYTWNEIHPTHTAKTWRSSMPVSLHPTGIFSHFSTLMFPKRGSSREWLAQSPRRSLKGGSLVAAQPLKPWDGLLWNVLGEGTWQPGATLVVWFQLDLIWICSSNHDGSYTKISV